MGGQGHSHTFLNMMRDTREATACSIDQATSGKAGSVRSVDLRSAFRRWVPGGLRDVGFRGVRKRFKGRGIEVVAPGFKLTLLQVARFRRKPP